MLEVLLSIVEHALPGCVVQVKEVLHFEAAATFVARLAQVVLREAAHNPLLRDTVGATAHKYNFYYSIYMCTAHCALLTAQCAEYGHCCHGLVYLLNSWQCLRSLIERLHDSAA